MSKLPPLPVENYVDKDGLWDEKYGPYTADQMRDYALAAVEAYKKSLKPVAWITQEHGAIRANPAFRISGPQTLNWKIPLFMLDGESDA